MCTCKLFAFISDLKLPRVTQPSHLKSKAQLNSKTHALTDFHALNQSDLTILTSTNQRFATSFCCFHAVISTIHSLVFKPMQPPMKCVYFYVLALTLAFPRDVRHVCPVVESVTSWGARCTRRVRVVPDVPLTLNKRKRARELLSQDIFWSHFSPLNFDVVPTSHI